MLNLMSFISFENVTWVYRPIDVCLIGSFLYTGFHGSDSNAQKSRLKLFGI